jgi:seryl-tRNA synthetase
VIDPVVLRENPDVVRRSQQLRGASVSLVDDAVAADTERRSQLARFEALRAEQNVFGKQVAQAKGDEKQALVAQAQQLAADVKAAQQAANDAGEQFDRIVGSLGNIPVDGVPAGGEDDWALIKTVGEPAAFDFEWGRASSSGS